MPGREDASIISCSSSRHIDSGMHFGHSCTIGPGQTQIYRRQRSLCPPTCPLGSVVRPISLTDGAYESVEDSLDESDSELEASRLASDYFLAPSRSLNVL